MAKIPTATELQQTNIDDKKLFIEGASVNENDFGAIRSKRNADLVDLGFNLTTTIDKIKDEDANLSAIDKINSINANVEISVSDLYNNADTLEKIDNLVPDTEKMLNKQLNQIRSTILNPRTNGHFKLLEKTYRKEIIDQVSLKSYELRKTEEARIKKDTTDRVIFKSLQTYGLSMNKDGVLDIDSFKDQIKLYLEQAFNDDIPINDILDIEEDSVLNLITKLTEEYTDDLLPSIEVLYNDAVKNKYITPSDQTKVSNFIKKKKLDQTIKLQTRKAWLEMPEGNLKDFARFTSEIKDKKLAEQVYDELANQHAQKHRQETSYQEQVINDIYGYFKENRIETNDDLDRIPGFLDLSNKKQIDFYNYLAKINAGKIDPNDTSVESEEEFNYFQYLKEQIFKNPQSVDYLLSDQERGLITLEEYLKLEPFRQKVLLDERYKFVYSAAKQFAGNDYKLQQHLLNVADKFIDTVPMQNYAVSIMGIMKDAKEDYVPDNATQEQVKEKTIVKISADSFKTVSEQKFFARNPKIYEDMYDESQKEDYNTGFKSFDSRIDYFVSSLKEKNIDLTTENVEQARANLFGVLSFLNGQESSISDYIKNTLQVRKFKLPAKQNEEKFYTAYIDSLVQAMAQSPNMIVTDKDNNRVFMDNEVIIFNMLHKRIINKDGTVSYILRNEQDLENIGIK